MSQRSHEGELAQGRAEIERIDKAIVTLLAERVAIGRRIGALKRVAGLPVLNPSREAEVIAVGRTIGRSAWLGRVPTPAWMQGIRFRLEAACGWR